MRLPNTSAKIPAMWSTETLVLAALDRFEAAIPGWVRPAAFGVAWEPDGEFTWARHGLGDTPLPAVVLATACGHTGGSASHRLTMTDLDHAITLLSPAEACESLDHPDLWAWRALRAALPGDAEAIAVFAEDLATDTNDPHVAALIAETMTGREENPDGTTTLWRPVGPAELAYVRETGTWPPRLPDQPIFYPVLNRAYAERIAREWNVPHSGTGYVTRFRVETGYLRRYPTRRAGGEEVLELWVPAEELTEFNRHIVGGVEVVAEFS